MVPTFVIFFLLEGEGGIVKTAEKRLFFCALLCVSLTFLLFIHKTKITMSCVSCKKKEGTLKRQLLDGRAAELGLFCSDPCYSRFLHGTGRGRGNIKVWISRPSKVKNVGDVAPQKVV